MGGRRNHVRLKPDTSGTFGRRSDAIVMSVVSGFSRTVGGGARNSNSIGRTDTKTIPIVTSEKLFLMIGTLPKNQPAPRHSDDPARSRRRRCRARTTPVVICAAPATNGTNVRTIGTKRPRMIALPPYCSKKACARSRYSLFSSRKVPAEDARPDEAADRVVDGVAGERGEHQQRQHRRHAEVAGRAQARRPRTAASRPAGTA